MEIVSLLRDQRRGGLPTYQVRAENTRESKMKAQSLVVVLVVCGMSWLAKPVSAQFYPGGYGSGWGGTNGSAALLGSNYMQASAMQAKAQNRLAGQQAAMGQNYVVQSGIRNTLSSQAQGRTDAIENQRQANQDWWFQYQTQQAGQRRNVEYSSAGGAVGSFGPSGSPPEAASDVIKWPTALQDSCFASERATIEAPYRRTPPQLSVPTQADYVQMVRTVEDMKAVLEWRLKEGIPTNDYNTATAFLAKLGQEIARRAVPGPGSK
jgi:hypothetical protein